MIRILCFVISEIVDDESYLVGTVRLLILLGLCSPLDCKLLTKLLELCLLLLLGKGFDLVYAPTLAVLERTERKAYLLGRLFELVMTRLFGMKACSSLGAEDLSAFATLNRLGNSIRVIDCPTKLLDMCLDSFLVALVDLFAHSFWDWFIRVGKEVVHSWLQKPTRSVSVGSQEYKATDRIANSDVLGDPLYW